MTEIRLRRDLLRQGFTSAEITTLANRGELTRVRRGAYAETAATDPLAAHRRLIEATAGGLDGGAVLSHHSAAVLHGLPTWAAELGRVHLTRPRSGGGQLRRWVHVHGLPLDDDEIVVINGLLVTGLARTLLDLGCRDALHRVVAVGDAALRIGMPIDELNELLDRRGGRHGIGAARRAAALFDARSESPGESSSRVVFHLAGIPTPQLQWEVLNDRGDFIARCDFGWPELQTVGEFDGRVKYGRGLRPDQDPVEVLFAEKRREDSVRDQGLQMVRWITDDLSDPRALLTRLRRAFERGRRGA